MSDIPASPLDLQAIRASIESPGADTALKMSFMAWMADEFSTV
jgi:hypothetical protein